MKKQKTVNTKGKWLIVLLLLFSISNLTLLSQTKNVGIGTTSPDGSALLDLDASDMGLLIPRMTEIQKNAISSPATGLIVYQTDGTAGFYYYSGTAWVKLTTVTEAIQYLPLAGGTMSGAIDMQNNIIENIGNAGTDFTASGGLNLADAVSAPRFASTVAIGTPPFTVASNTLVTNLNADLLDGKHSTDFASSTHSHAILTRGDGLTGDNYDGSTARSWAIDFAGTGSAVTVARSDHSHSDYEPTLTKGNITETNSSVLTISGGSGAVMGSGTTIEVKNTTALWNANKLQNADVSEDEPEDGQLLQFDGTDFKWKPATISSGGTVTSVGLSMPTNEFDVGTTSITESGTFNVTWKSQSANSFLSAPSNEGGTPTFRGLTAEDIPATLPASKIGSGELPVVRGGTGAATLTGILKGNGTDAFSGITATAGQVTFWSDANTIAGNSSITWNSNTLTIDGDLQVTGEIDPISLTLIPQAEAPTVAARGKMYFDDGESVLKVYINETTGWVALGSGGAGGAELPEGEANQTLRYDITNGWVGSSALINTGTQVGVDGDLSVAGSISANGNLIYTPSVESENTINTAGKTYIKVNYNGTITLSNGTTAGQVIILQKISSETATLENSDNCKITGNWDGSEYDIIQLIWDGTAWVEISRSNNSL